MIKSVLGAIGRVMGGAASTVGSMFIAGGYGAYKASGLFKYQGWKQSLSHGNPIPFTLKTGLGPAAFLGLTAVGIGAGAMGLGSVDEKTALDPNSGLPYSDIPNTVGRYISPTATSIANKGIDDMGATGELVFALNNNRK